MVPPNISSATESMLASCVRYSPSQTRPIDDADTAAGAPKHAASTRAIPNLFAFQNMLEN